MWQIACIIPKHVWLLYGFGSGFNIVSYKDLGDKNRGVQEVQYFMVLTGPIFYGINQSMRL